jgi:hypothetical protein
MICSITAPDSYICAENAAFCTSLLAKTELGLSTNALSAARPKDSIVELTFVDCQKPNVEKHQDIMMGNIAALSIKLPGQLPPSALSTGFRTLI